MLAVDRSGDPLSQIADALEQFDNLRSLVVISHGVDGGLTLGGQWIDQPALHAGSDALQRIRDNLAENADTLSTRIVQ